MLLLADCNILLMCAYSPFIRRGPANFRYLYANTAAGSPLMTFEREDGHLLASNSEMLVSFIVCEI